MREIQSADYKTVPWKNGLGVTTEIFVSPRGILDFNWRVSIATVEQDLPFSKFPGCERHLVVLEGSGMSLEFGDGQSLVFPLLVPQRFSGDLSAFGRLTQGAVRDFNLIVRRDFAKAELRVLKDHMRYKCLHAHALVHVIGGNSFVLEAGESFDLEPSSIALASEITLLRT